jgi:two-component system, LytTR family, sensor histidine kinase AlgZ
MLPSRRPVRTSIDNVIPDCCNIGIVLRVLLAVNIIIFITMLLQANSLTAGVITFVESAMPVELVCLSSLLVLCGLRKPMRATPQWIQRAACILVSATMTMLSIFLLSPVDTFLYEVGYFKLIKEISGAGLLGILLQHYFEVRTRAFSPALAEARLQALQARIRPHFLFNSLNAVLSLIRTEPRRAETTLEDLADLFRILMRDARDMTTLEDEIHLCKQYLSIESIRLGERLQVEWCMNDIAPKVLSNAQIPSLLLQPLVENAIHYGIEPVHDSALIQIQVSRSHDSIDIIIINPYHDTAPAPGGNQMALANIRERLALLYDVEAQLTTTIADGYFKVRLRFPYVTST